MGNKIRTLVRQLHVIRLARVRRALQVPFDHIHGDGQPPGVRQHSRQLRVRHRIRPAPLLHRRHDELAELAVQLGADGFAFLLFVVFCFGTMENGLD